MLLTGRMAVGLAFDWTNSNLPYGLGLMVALLIGAVAIALVKRWYQQDTSATMSPSAQLAEFRSLYDQGAMSKAEFDRLRALLGDQIREMNNIAPDRRALEPDLEIEIEVDEAPTNAPPPAAKEVTPPSPETGDRPA